MSSRLARVHAQAAQAVYPQRPAMGARMSAVAGSAGTHEPGAAGSAHAPGGSQDDTAAKVADIRFLVVEDQDFQRALIVRMLTAIGARDVVEAVDGHAALELWKQRERPIDIIITDLDMPRMDGMEFIRHLGEEGYPVSVILASVHDRALLASVGTMTEAYGITLLGTIAKPVTVQKLQALINL